MAPVRMEPVAFRTHDAKDVAAVTAEEMRAVDRVAVETIGLSLVQMMEHAGRGLALEAIEMDPRGPTVVLAGAGGNGGGGLACARHLINRDRPVAVVLDRSPDEFEGVPATQLEILEHEGVSIETSVEDVADPGLVIDAIVGYGLSGAPRGRMRELVDWTTAASAPVLSLDVPTGRDATTGDRPGVAIRPDRTVTLALPKTGLTDVEGDLVLADISIPHAVYDRVGIPYENPFADEFAVELRSTESVIE